MFSNLVKVIEVLQKGRPIIILDDRTRENEADLVVAAEVVNKYAVNFMVRHSSGVICVATTEEQLNRLGLVRVCSSLHKTDPLSTPFALSCEASSNITTGISAGDRALSIKVVGDPNSKVDDIVVPGHIFPLASHPDGLNGREGHTEASVELCRLANLWPAAAIVEIASEDGNMLKGKAVRAFAATYDIPIISIQEIKQALKTPMKSVIKTADANLPTELGHFHINIWQNIYNFKEHIVLTTGNLKGERNVPVRIHSQCLTGDLFHSLRCDCGPQLNASLRYMEQIGKGIFIWLRQEGRGIGLTNKIKAYNLQDTLKLDTVDANVQLNLPVDARSFNEAVEIINYYEPASIELLTNNPQKLQELEQSLSIPVVRKELITGINKENEAYLNVKKHRLNHLLNIDDPSSDNQ